MRKKLSALIVLILPFATFFWGYSTAEQKIPAQEIPVVSSSSDATVAPRDLDLSLFWRVWQTVSDKYVDTKKINSQTMLYGAIKGVVKSLGDPHSEFLDPKESEEFQDALEGSLTGIGAEVGIKDDSLVVVSPLKGSPAEKAGLKSGDHIFKIDGVLASDFSLFEAVQKIRGPAGTIVTLTIFREGEIEPREIKITREFINIDSVTSKLRDDGIAVVIVSTFADNTADEFNKTLSELALKSPRGLILDLRDNGGGYLDAAVTMTSKLLASGDVVTIKERGKPDETLRVSSAPIFPTTPLIVLVNGGSASASEIMAGALQDNQRAKIIGETTFGKGTVQELISDFADGSTLRITVAKWFTPAGHDITAKGITPDVEVKLTNQDFDAKKDPQMEKAVELLKSESH